MKLYSKEICFESGVPKIKYTPELSDAEKALRNYVIYGKKSLTDADWSVVAEGSEADYNFFKVGVDLK